MLAQEVFDQAAALLNDTGLNLFTYTAQLPYLKKASEELEKKFAIFGVEVERVKSTIINAPANTTAFALTLPSDFLLPLSLKERPVGGTTNDWSDMTERVWEPDLVPVNALTYWAFRNNGIYVPGAIVDREILLQYDRKLGVLIGSSSTIDYEPSKTWLAARTAELCARYIGMNKVMADDIKDNEVLPAEDELLRMLTLNSQGNSARRKRFTAKRLEVI